MAVQQTIHYELANSADLNQLVSDLAQVEAGTIVIAFLASPSWKPSDLEIARLVAAARTSNKRLVAERGVGAISERAVLLGFHDSVVVSDAPNLALLDPSTLKTFTEAPTAVIRPLSSDDEPTATIPAHSTIGEVPTSAIRTPDWSDSTADLATYTPPTRQAVDEDTSVKDAPEVLATVQAPEPIAARLRGETVTEPTVEVRPDEHVPEPVQPVVPPVPISRSIGRMPAPIPIPTKAAVHAAPPKAARRRRLGVARISAAVLAPLIVIAVVVAIAIYTLPTASVTLIADEEAITSALTYGIATTSVNLDIAIDPTPLNTTSTAEATSEATGERYEPVGTASGVIQITNPLTQEVTIPAGTEVPGSNGVTYYTAEDVQLSAADPYGSMSFGSGNVGVYAGVLGPDGNFEAGSLTGQLGNQMFYTNPEAIGGGRLEQYSVVTEEDVTAAREQVERELLELAEEEFADQIPDQYEVIPGTLEVDEPEIEVSASAGDDGESVSASGSISVSAQLFDAEELHQLAGDEADRQLARQGGSERILLAESVTLKEPTDLDGSTPAFRVNVEAIARTVITEAEREALVEDLAGLSREEAEEILDSHPKVDQYQISIEPSWFLDRMPEIASRIDIHVSSGEQTASR